MICDLSHLNKPIPSILASCESIRIPGVGSLNAWNNSISFSVPLPSFRINNLGFRILVDVKLVSFTGPTGSKFIGVNPGFTIVESPSPNNYVIEF